MTQHSKQQGLSLVELLVALALSSFLLLGLFQIFNSNSQAFNLQGGVARVQESGRISMEFLSRGVRAAAFLGCASGDASSPFTNGADTSEFSNVAFRNELIRFNGDNGITGFDNVTGAVTTLNNMGLSVGTGAQQIVSGTDVFIVHGAESCGLSVTASDATSITVPNASSCDIATNDLVIVSSCARAELFSITSDPTATNVLNHGTSHNNSANFADDIYDPDGSYLYLPTITAYHVGNTADGGRALFMTQINRSGETSSFSTQEIAEGVEDMQVLYGEDTNDDGTANRYVAADDVDDFLNVVAVRTRILTASEDRTVAENQTYNFNGTATTAADLRFYVPYETTNTIRNRLK
ncbi:hypothetical protein A3715_09590 [Oleiphilus sp. HI0009]|nr:MULTISPECIES: PilW family protein [unclassified Oleiphilus]KZX79061.1 hypothetical protein A3715_09590 [Oleiphilus sp. HI0009]KZY66420.1 hypothetical protein A3738_06475 [Oleiphilus sp. HI0066]KZY73854.1 hypothetical protein A3739_15010 [Oleiphilus sp. HI0067]